MKDFKEMLCPVCGEFEFNRPSDGDYVFYEDGLVRCTKCGWIYDLKQTENPDLKEGFNKLSLNEYKKDFAAKIAKKPDYDWFDENPPKMVPHKCPVCGEHTFPEEFSFEICPICGWQDDGFDSEPDYIGASEVSFNEAKAIFKDKRASNPNYRWDVENIRRKNK